MHCSTFTTVIPPLRHVMRARRIMHVKLSTAWSLMWATGALYVATLASACCASCVNILRKEVHCFSAGLMWLAGGGASGDGGGVSMSLGAYDAQDVYNVSMALSNVQATGNKVDGTFFKMCT